MLLWSGSILGLISDRVNMIFLVISTILLQLSTVAGAYTIKAGLAQKSYEFWSSQKCENANPAELKTLEAQAVCVNCLTQGKIQAGQDLDDVTEELFFDLAARKQSEILNCQISKTTAISNDSSDAKIFRAQIIDDIAQKLPALRELSRKIAELKARRDSSELYLAGKVTSPEGVEKSFATIKETNGDLRVLAPLYAALNQTLWNSNDPNMQEYIQLAIGSSLSPDEFKVEAHKSAGGINGFFRNKLSFSRTLEKMKQSYQIDLDLFEEKKVNKDGKDSYALDQNMKELIVKKGNFFESLVVLKDIKEKKIVGLTCRLEARYGKGADYLSNTFLASTLALGGVGLLTKLSTFGKIGASLAAQKSQIFLNSSRVLITGSAMMGTALSVEDMVKTCGSYPNIREDKCAKNETFAESESVKLSHGNCALSVVLMGAPLGVGVLANLQALKALASRSKHFMSAVKERNLEKFIADSVNFSAEEISLLKSQATKIFESAIKPEEKIKKVGQLYLEARIKKLPLSKQELARSVLQNIQKDKTSYSNQTQIFIENELDPSLVNYQLTLSHEFEHIAQHLDDKNIKNLLNFVKSVFSGKVSFPETYGSRRYRHEIEAIGTQYDIIKLFPEEVVRKEASALNKMESLRSSSGVYIVDFHDQIRLASALKMSREEYIAVVRNSHGYHGIWAYEKDLGTLWKTTLNLARFLAVVKLSDALRD